MRDVLCDIVRQTMGLFEKVKINETGTETNVEAAADGVLFLKARLNEPLSDNVGSWGIGDLSLLNGLLNLAQYRSDNSVFDVKRRAYNNQNVVEHLEFKEGKSSVGAIHRTIKGELVGEQATIPNIVWNVSFEPQKSKIAEFQSLASLYATVSRYFRVETRNGELIFCIGDNNSSTHRVEMVFENGVSGEIPPGMDFSIPQFLSIIKQAGSNPLMVNITTRRAIQLTVTTSYGTYDYFLRAKIKESN